MAESKLPELDPEFEKELPDLEPGQFPPYVQTDEERLRFRMSVAIAKQLFPGEDEDPANIWHAARSLYRNPNIQTA